MQISAGMTLFVALAAFANSAASAGGPSFSCARARSADERAICRSPALSAADARMTALYRDIQGCTMMGARDNNIDDQRAWLVRRSQCVSDATCLTPASIVPALLNSPRWQQRHAN